MKKLLNYAPNMIDVETEDFKKVLQSQIHLPRNFGLMRGSELSYKNPAVRTGKRTNPISKDKKKALKYYQDYGKNMSEHYKSMPLTKKVGKKKGSIVPINRDIFKPVEDSKHPSPFRDSNTHYQQTKALNKKIAAGKAYKSIRQNKEFLNKNTIDGVVKKMPDTQPRNYVTDRMSQKQREEAHRAVHKDTNTAFTKSLDSHKIAQSRSPLSVQKILGSAKEVKGTTTHPKNLLTTSHKAGILQNQNANSNATHVNRVFGQNVSLSDVNSNSSKLNVKGITGLANDVNKPNLGLRSPLSTMTNSHKEAVLKNMGISSEKGSLFDPIMKSFDKFFGKNNPGEAEYSRIFNGMTHVSGVSGFKTDLGGLQNLSQRELEHLKKGVRNEASKFVRTRGANVDPFLKENHPEIGPRPNLLYEHAKRFRPSEGVNGYGLGAGNVLQASRAELASRGIGFLTGAGAGEALANSVGVMTSIQKAQMKSRTNLFSKITSSGFMAVAGTYGTFMGNAISGGGIDDFVEGQLTYVAGLQGWRIGSSFGGALGSEAAESFHFKKGSSAKASFATNAKNMKSSLGSGIIRGGTTFLGGVTGAAVGAGLVAGTAALVRDVVSNDSVIRKFAKNLANSNMAMSTEVNNKTLTARSAALNKLAKSGLNDRALLLGNEARILKGYM